MTPQIPKFHPAYFSAADGFVTWFDGEKTTVIRKPLIIKPILKSKR